MYNILLDGTGQQPGNRGRRDVQNFRDLLLGLVFVVIQISGLDDQPAIVNDLFHLHYSSFICQHSYYTRRIFDNQQINHYIFEIIAKINC